MKPITILFIDHASFLGGSQIALLGHLRLLDKNRFRPIVACSVQAESSGLAEELKKLSIPYYLLPMDRLKIVNPVVIKRFIESRRALKKILASEPIDIIFSNTVRAMLLTASLPSKKIRAIWYLQDFTFPKILFRLFRHRADKIVFNSSAVAGFYGIKETAEIVHVGSDIMNAHLPASGGKEEKIRGIYGFKDDELIVGYIGRLVRSKGVYELLDAYEKILPRMDRQTKLLLVGTGRDQNGDIETDLIDRVKEKKLDKLVIFTGHKKNIFPYLRSMDVLCFPSLAPESFGLVIIEAMMSNVAVIATRTGGPEEIIRDESIGLLVRPGDVDELARAIMVLAEDPELRQAITDCASVYAAENYSLEKMNDKLEKIYLALAERS